MAERFDARFLFHLVLLSLILGSANGNGLKFGFYETSCPDAEAIVRKTVSSYFSQDPTVSAPLLRLHFHDCFVRGCDGSVLLNSTETNLAEKEAMPNQSLDGFYVIDAAKAALEKACPGTVSCADIVALVARDAVSLLPSSYFAEAMSVAVCGDHVESSVPSQATGQGNSLYQVHTGRRDGFVSKASEAVANIPSAFSDFAELKAEFASKGLSVKDLAVLSGAHAIGNSHCFSFGKRLNNYKGKGDIDPTLDPNFAMELRNKCSPGINTVVEMVPGSSTSFDTKYYDLVAKRKGLFRSDEALLQDKRTRDYVYSRLHAPESSFFYDFGKSMMKMGKVGVLTGNTGEIRRNCALVNH
ncbi:hypothetical protein C4D60_Mb06t23400 [Musa balbisiana]|uniref:Peroxidase n=1 Tax=Musa balbisiana TaxID=52838 RepID=A0A4S8IQ55_MUSBA|nr:hypothetical protein C4D60_Mb06t23400 [Musa balbisiana]